MLPLGSHLATKYWPKWTNDMTQRITLHVLNFLEEDIKYFRGTKWGVKEGAFCGVCRVGGVEGQRNKRIWEIFQQPVLSPPPPTSEVGNSPLQSQFPSRFQEWLQPQEENQAYGSVLLDMSTMLAGLLRKIPFYLPTALWPQVVISNKVCFHWFFWT